MRVVLYEQYVVLLLDGHREGFHRGPALEAFGFPPEVALELGKTLVAAAEAHLSGK